MSRRPSPHGSQTIPARRLLRSPRAWLPSLSRRSAPHGTRTMPARRRLRRLRAWLPLGMLVGASFALLVFWLGAHSSAAPALAVAPAAADSCRVQPAFTANEQLGLVEPLALATDQPERGLVLLGANAGRYQHPSWDDAGFLGALAYDSAGNVYVAPTPRQSLADNPLAGATTLWRVDAVTATLQPFVTFAGSASERNPFGILGLAYACELDRLYVGTVIGSTPDAERGGLFALELASKAQTPVLAGVDVLGILVVRAGTGYELYASLARSPEIIALPLDAQGNPAGPPRLLIDLTTGGAAASERARKLRLVDGNLVVDLIPFNYSLQGSASSSTQSRRLVWSFDPQKKLWLAQTQAN